MYIYTVLVCTPVWYITMPQLLRCPFVLSMFVSSKWQRVGLPMRWRGSVSALFYCWHTFLDHRTNISRKVRAPRRASVSGAPNNLQNGHLDKNKHGRNKTVPFFHFKGPFFKTCVAHFKQNIRVFNDRGGSRCTFSILFCSNKKGRSFTFYIYILQENSKGKRMKNFFCKNNFLRVIYDLKLIIFLFWQACFNGCYSGPAREGPCHPVTSLYRNTTLHFFILFSSTTNIANWFQNPLDFEIVYIIGISFCLIFMLGILLDNFSNSSC